MSMWKVVIADDEPKILRGLKNMLQRMPLGLEVAGLADNGLKALELVDKLQPDILLVDINMPFLNGLELIARLRERREDMRILVITGYEEFEYARQAVELSVFAYLLKPVGEQELFTKLQRAIEELTVERERHRYYAFAAEQMEKRRDMLIENFLRDVTAGEYEEPEISQRCAWFGLQPDNLWELLLIVPAISSAETAPEQDLMLRYEVEAALKHRYGPLESARVFSDARGNVLVLYEPLPSTQPLRAEQMAAAIREDTGIRVSLSKAPLKALCDLMTAYDQLMERCQDIQGLSPIVAAAQQHILKHYADPSLGLLNTAEVAGVTPTYLSRLMKQELGMPFSRYLNSIRINQAIALMEKGFKLKDIALRVGYSSPYYFSTAFKKMLSIPPSEYRSEEMRK